MRFILLSFSSSHHQPQKYAAHSKNSINTAFAKQITNDFMNKSS